MAVSWSLVEVVAPSAMQAEGQGRTWGWADEGKLELFWLVQCAEAAHQGQAGLAWDHMQPPNRCTGVQY